MRAYISYIKSLFTRCSERSLVYSQRPENRFWWYCLPDVSYVPPLYSFLTRREWAIIESWYADTNSKNLVGESAVPVMSVMQGFIMGSSVSNVVQLGHYSGYSTLLLGFMLRRIGKKNSLFTIDIDPYISGYTQKWVNRAGLKDYVRVQTGNSSDPSMVERTREYFGGDPKMVFIDSSHQYGHTLQEINLWYGHLEEGGFIFLHDSSVFATQYDSTNLGGVRKALDEWREQNGQVEVINICGDMPPEKRLVDFVYRDSCGLGIIQKT